MSKRSLLQIIGVTVLLLCLTASTAFAGQVVYRYDEMGRLIEVDYGRQGRLEYHYDQEGSLLQRRFFDAHLAGDVDGNNVVNVADAILILRHIVGLIDIESLYGPSALSRARVSGATGPLNIADAILILRYIVGLTDFPA